jgi:hypothetical protein
MEGFGWNLRCAQHSDENIVSGLCGKLAGQRLAKQEFVPTGRNYGALMESPESFINGIEGDTGSAPAGFVVRNDGVKRDKRSLRKQVFAKRCARCDRVPC